MVKAKIKGLTLHRPWGYAITYLDKRVENRPYPCFLNRGDYIAIHNGKAWDEEGAAFVRSLNSSELIANPTQETDPPGMIIAIARYCETVEYSDSPWFFGKYGWVLDEVTAIDPVPCRGQQRLWDLPENVIWQVRSNFQQAQKQIRGQSGFMTVYP